jgi:DNA-binding MarR family transcriptional regulator
MATRMAQPYPATDRIMDVFLTKPAFLLARVDQICTALYTPLSQGETLAQAEFLLLLAQSDDRDQISLSRAAGIDKSTTALILDNLAATGLIERVACPSDRRRTRPRLTEGGRARAADATAAYASLQAQLTAPLPHASELVALLRTLALAPDGPAPHWAAEDAPALLADAPSLLDRRALQVAQAHFLACTAPLSLTPRQYSVLVILAARPGMGQVEFSRLFGLDPSTAGLVMRNLIARDLIEDRLSPTDRRKRVHALTRAGHETLAAAMPLVDRSEQFTVAALTRSQIAQLIGHLQAVVFAHSHRMRFPGELHAPA